jgi:transcriptional regulator
MYTPHAFVESDLCALDALAASDSFITLVTVADGTPQVSHLPVLYRRDGERVELIGHFARPNLQARHAGPALAIFHGPDCYISPAWYPDKEAQARVPTWNYAVAHVHGEMTTFDDTDALTTLVSTLTGKYETSVGSDWRFDPDRPDHRSQLRGIVGFRLQAERILLKFKLNQNHPIANRSSVIERLEALGDMSGREVAALMRARLATPVAEDS